MHTLIVHAAHEVRLTLPLLINSMEENLIEGCYFYLSLLQLTGYMINNPAIFLPAG
jgi:hypothetical protein